MGADKKTHTKSKSHDAATSSSSSTATSQLTAAAAVFVVATLGRRRKLLAILVETRSEKRFQILLFFPSFFLCNMGPLES